LSCFGQVAVTVIGVWGTIGLLLNLGMGRNTKSNEPALWGKAFAPGSYTDRGRKWWWGFMIYLVATPLVFLAAAAVISRTCR